MQPLDNVNLTSFQWVKAKHVGFSIDFASWCQFPFDCMEVGYFVLGF